MTAQAEKLQATLAALKRAIAERDAKVKSLEAELEKLKAEVVQ